MSFPLFLKMQVQSPQNIPFIQSLARFKLVDKKLNILETNHPDFAHPKPQPPPTEKFQLIHSFIQGVMLEKYNSNFLIGWLYSPIVKNMQSDWTPPLSQSVDLYGILYVNV